MGQQQLLLLVLGVVLVGVSIATGGYILSDRNENQQYDQLTKEGLEVASRIVAWKNKPSAMGGGKNIQYAKGITFGQLGYIETNGAGTKSHNDPFRRFLKSTNGKRPYVRVQHADETHLRVDVFMYGTDAGCFKTRRARKIDGSWVNSGLDIKANNPPEGCPVW